MKHWCLTILTIHRWLLHESLVPSLPCRPCPAASVLTILCFYGHLHNRRHAVPGERANGRTRGQESVLQAPIWSRNHWVLPKGTQNKSVLQISHWTKSGTFGVLTTRLLEAKLALQISCSLCMCRTAWSRDTSCQRCCGHPVGDFLRQKPAHPIWKISYKKIPIQKESKGIQSKTFKN